MIELLILTQILIFKILFNLDYQTICRLKEVAQEKLTSREAIFDKLRSELTVAENIKGNYIIQVNQQDTHEEKLLNSIRYLYFRKYNGMELNIYLLLYYTMNNYNYLNCFIKIICRNN